MRKFGDALLLAGVVVAFAVNQATDGRETKSTRVIPASFAAAHLLAQEFAMLRHMLEDPPALPTAPDQASPDMLIAI